MRAVGDVISMPDESRHQIVGIRGYSTRHEHDGESLIFRFRAVQELTLVRIPEGFEKLEMTVVSGDAIA